MILHLHRWKPTTGSDDLPTIEWAMNYGLDNQRKDSGWQAAKTIGHPSLWASYESKS